MKQITDSFCSSLNIYPIIHIYLSNFDLIYLLRKWLNIVNFIILQDLIYLLITFFRNINSILINWRYYKIFDK